MSAKLVLASLAIAFAATAQTTLNLSEDLVRLGIASGNMVPNDPTTDAGPLFFRAVLYAKNNQFGRVIADPGAYYFQSLQYLVSTSTQYGGAHVAWDSLSNITIDLQGSDLYFSNPLVGGMSITNSTNVVLENFTADYDPLPFTQVRVTSVDAAHRQIQFAVDGNWQNPSILNPVFGLPPNNFQAVEVHIFRNGRSIPGVPRMNAANPVGNTQFTIAPDPTSYATSSVIGQIRPGDIAFLGMRYGGSPVTVLHCTGCMIRNIKAYSGPDIAFNISFAESSVLERLYSIPRPGTDRLVSNYGGIFMADPLPNNQVRLNRMIRTMDNSLEYDNTVIGTVTSQTDSRTFVLSGSLTSLLSYGLSVPNGSAISFQRVSDGAIVASAVTTSPVVGPYSGNQATFRFDRDLPASIVGTVMVGTDPSLRAANAVIEKNAAEEETDCCNGLFVGGGANSVLRGNYVHRSAMSGVLISNDLRPGGFNSPPAANFAVMSNVIDGANFTRTGYPTLQLGSVVVTGTDAPNLLTTSPHQNISVTGNFIADSGSAAVWLGNTTNGTVTGNYFLNPNTNPAVESAVSFFGPANQPLVVQASQNVVANGNTIDQTSRRAWITDEQFRELAAYAPGSTIRLNAYEIGTTFDAPTITLTDADGVVTPLAIQSSTAHALDVQIHAAAALGGAHVTVVAGGLKYFGTLFIDSQDNVPALNGCTYEMSPAATSTGASAASLPVLVVTQAGCSYSIASSDSFVTTGAAGSGTSIVSIGFTANSGSPRNTTVEIAGQPIAITQAAATAAHPTIQAIVDAWTYSAGLAAGEWVTITGSGFTTGPARVWNLAGARALPLSLGGASVTFNGIPAALYYVSPTQINALAPSGIAPGPVQVVVQVNGLSSNPFTITASATRPAVYALPTADAKFFFVTAALAGTGMLVGDSAVDPRVLRGAKSGDVLDLYMIGLGATADRSNFITDRVFSGAFPLSDAVTVTINGKNAPVAFAGLTSPGLYLVRITVPPDLAPGPEPIQVSIGTERTPSSLMILVAPSP